MTSPRILAFDIETTHLKGNMGHLLTTVAKEIGGRRVWRWRIDKQDHWDWERPATWFSDRQMVEEIVEVLGTADMLVTQFGTYFDIPFVNTRALVNGTPMLPPPPLTPHLDIWKVAKTKLALTSNRQETICDAVGSRHPKYKPGWECWRRAMHGDKRAIGKLLKYNENDVDGLIDNYLALKPLMVGHPVLRRVERLSEPHSHCPACESGNTQSRGWRRTRCGRSRRMQCQDCGLWFVGAAEKKGKR